MSEVGKETAKNYTKAPFAVLSFCFILKLKKHTEAKLYSFYI